MDTPIIHKYCSKCKENLPTSEFYKDKSKRDGLTSYCKACKKAHSKKWCKANPEKAAAYKKKYCEANPEKVAAYKKKYCEANPEKVAAGKKKYCEANPEKVTASKQKWRKANPEKVKAASHRRRALKRNAEGTHDAAQAQARTAVHGDSCVYCASTQDLHIDHIKPLSKGGSNWPSNLAPACAKCNISKNDKWGEDLLAWVEQNCTVERTKKILGFVLHSGA